MSQYTENILNNVKAQNSNEPEFHQAVEEMLGSLEVVLDRHPEYKHAKILERMVEPERSISFRVPWMDDQGEIHINRGYRIEMNSAAIRFYEELNDFLPTEKKKKRFKVNFHGNPSVRNLIESLGIPYTKVD